MQTLIKTATLIDGTGESAKPGWSLLVQDGIIIDCAPAAHFDGIDAEIVDLTAGVVVPGFLDVHTHFCYIHEAGFQQSAMQPNKVAMLDAGFDNAEEWLHQGVTTTRLVGTPFDLDIELRSVIETHALPSPRMVCAGRMMTMVGGRRTAWDFMKEEVNGVEEARRFARAHLQRGADVIKLYCTTLLEANVADYLTRALALPDDAPDPGRWSSLTVDEIAAVCDEAHNIGRTVAAHVAPTFGIKIALRGGVDTIEHGTNLDNECIDLFLETGATLVPTLSVTHYQIANGDHLDMPPVFTAFSRRSWDKQIKMLRKAFDAGVKIATGTDSIIAGMQFYDEVELLVTAVGISPMDALVAATRNGARALGIAGEKVGTLETGKYADLVLLADDPLTDIHNIRNITAVVQSGSIVARPNQSDGKGQRGHHD
ncbi:MAG: amidohydrolase family protein [Chloroflexota bacterium]|nr:amidohydrolase family protein [Chloroflexota bacterium]